MRHRKSSSSRKNKPGYRVRIIGGQWKRSILPVSVVPDLRPTPGRVRETLFNWLYTLFDGRWEEMNCLDLFAGTGAFGFEAASRGAREVTMVESHRTAFAQLQETSDKLDAGSFVTLVQGDAILTAARLVAQKKHFDVIFLDPPFQDNILPDILPYCADLLKEEGVVYVESPVFLVKETLENLSKNGRQWHIIRQDRAGHVCYHLLRLQYMDNLQA
jgi:16S rRNA (guanine(966)-N(2))-methyltransferase RsmD